MALPSLDDLVFLPTDEAEAAIRASLPSGLSLHFSLEDQQWQIAVVDGSGEAIWRGSNTDRRVLLFDAYGYILQAAGLKSRHPVWQRRGEVQIPARYGVKSYQGDITIPDPDDLKPDELLEIYGIHTKKDKSR